ncbi:hypothetical protein QFC19_001966 [Naganishia cerealis]|uniref:Uncharacterized protein n=1 Tax=Naganishia cerealis TaxID=610337 RepID=A0ACC2WFW5_9TREE|nr:hypothetical protein QFC19_001966 [Naganishia cerealis]
MSRAAPLPFSVRAATSFSSTIQKAARPPAAEHVNRHLRNLRLRTSSIGTIPQDANVGLHNHVRPESVAYLRLKPRSLIHARSASSASAVRVTEEEDSYDWYDWNHNYQLPAYVDPYLPLAFSSHHARVGGRSAVELNAQAVTDEGLDAGESSYTTGASTPTRSPTIHPPSTHESCPPANETTTTWSEIQAALQLPPQAAGAALQECVNRDCHGVLCLIRSNATPKEWHKILDGSRQALRVLRIEKRSLKLPDTIVPMRILQILASIQSGQTAKSLGLLSRLLAEASPKTIAQYLSPLLMVIQQSSARHHRPEDVLAALVHLFNKRNMTSQKLNTSLRKAAAKVGASIADPVSWLKQEVDKVKTIPDAMRSQMLQEAIAEAVVFATKDTASASTLKNLYDEIFRLQINISRNSAAGLSLKFAQLGSREDALSIYASTRLEGTTDKPVPEQYVRMLHHIDELGEVARILSQDSRSTEPRFISDVLKYCIQRGEEDMASKIVLLHYPRVSEALYGDLPKTQLLKKEEQVLQWLFTAYLDSGDLTKAHGIMQTMIAQGVSLRLAQYNALLKAFVVRADIDSAHRLLDHMRRASIAPDLNIYSTLMSLYVNQKVPGAVENIFDEMQKEGIVPDAVAYAIVLNAYLEAGDWTRAATVWRECPTDVRGDKSIVNTLLKGMVLLSAPFQEVYRMFASVFPDPSKADAQTWTMLIQSACDGGHLPRARELFSDFIHLSKQEHSTLRLDHFLTSVLVIGHIRNGEIATAKEIYDAMEKEGVMNTSVTYATIIDAALKGQWPMSATRAKELAHRLLDQTTRLQREPRRGRGQPVENIIVPLIRSAVKVGDIAEVERYFKLAIEKGVQPSIPLYTMLLDTYRRAGEYERVQQVWEGIYALAIEQKAGPPGAEGSRGNASQDRRLCVPLSVYIEAMSSASRHQDILRVWSDLHEHGFGFDAHNWNHLAVSLTRSGDILRAFNIVENVLIKREEEIAARRFSGLRPESELEPVVRVDFSTDNHTSLLEEHLLLDPAQRPPNRRHEFREDLESYRAIRQERSFQLDSPSDKPTPVFDSNIFTRWRPTDAMWRPAYLTIAVLDRAYLQLENGRSVFGLMAGEEEDGDVGEELGVNLEPSSGAPAQHRKGTPMALLTKINSKYAKTVSLIMLHRRKRKDGELIRKRSNNNNV